MEPGGQGRCPGSPAASPVSRCWVSHRTDAAIAALAQCKRRCVTRLPSPGPPPLPKEPPRPQPPPHRMDARGRGTNPRGMRCGHPGATRVSPFHPLACTPQQAEPAALPTPAASHGAAAGTLLPAGSACAVLPKKVPWESLGWLAASVSGPVPMPRRPPSRWAALKLVGNFLNRVSTSQHDPRLAPSATFPSLSLGAAARVSISAENISSCHLFLLRSPVAGGNQV